MRIQAACWWVRLLQQVSGRSLRLARTASLLSNSTSTCFSFYSIHLFIFSTFLSSLISFFVTFNMHPFLGEIWIMRDNFMLFHIALPGETRWIKGQKKSCNFTVSPASTSLSAVVVEETNKCSVCTDLPGVVVQYEDGETNSDELSYLWAETSWPPPPCRRAAGDSWGPGRGRRRTLPGRRHVGPDTAGQPPDESRPAWRRTNNMLVRFCSFFLNIFYSSTTTIM